MDAPGEDRFVAALGACTAELARIIDGDLDRPVPACPGRTFRQLATHPGRGHRWAAQVVATRATVPVPVREVPDGKLPGDPAQHAYWLNEGAGQVITAVTAAGNDPVRTLAGLGPASFRARRRARDMSGDGQSLHFRATDPGLPGTGERLVTRTPSGITVHPGHARADVAVRGPPPACCSS